MSIFAIIGKTCLALGGLVFINECIPRIFGSKESLITNYMSGCESLGVKANGFIKGLFSLQNTMSGMIRNS